VYVLCVDGVDVVDFDGCYGNSVGGICCWLRVVIVMFRWLVLFCRVKVL